MSSEVERAVRIPRPRAHPRPRRQPGGLQSGPPIARSHITDLLHEFTGAAPLQDTAEAIHRAASSTASTSSNETPPNSSPRKPIRSSTCMPSATMRRCKDDRRPPGSQRKPYTQIRMAQAPHPRPGSQARLDGQRPRRQNHRPRPSRRRHGGHLHRPSPDPE